MRRVIFDTDAGSDIDDLYALALIVNHPELELLGVTTVAGDTTARARLAAKMLRLAERGDVPVFAGIEVPEALRQRGIDRESYRQNLTHTQLVEPGDPEYEQEFGDAIDFMLGALSAAERPVTIVATGPWTNVAELLRRADEKQKSMIECLALMGGEVRLMHRESNVANDPEGAALILESGLPIFMGTWSVTRQLYFTMAEVDALIGSSTSPFLRALYRGTQMWWAEARMSKPGPVCYDVIPAFWAAGDRADISCVKLEKIRVELEGKYTRGMTVTSPWTLMKAEPTDATSPEYVTATDAMDAEALKTRYTELVV